MEIGETKTMGVVDDDGVRIGYVDTILNDGRREQHIVVVVNKAKDYLFQLFGLHLSVTYRHTCVWHIFLYYVSYMVKTLDIIIDKKHLTVTAQFKTNGIGYHLSAKRCQHGLYGITVGRWGAHNTHITGSHQGEL